MCELVGLEVLGLKRVRIGSVVLGKLPLGQWRYLRSDRALRADARSADRVSGRCLHPPGPRASAASRHAGSALRARAAARVGRAQRRFALAQSQPRQRQVVPGRRTVVLQGGLRSKASAAPARSPFA